MDTTYAHKTTAQKLGLHKYESVCVLHAPKKYLKNTAPTTSYDDTLHKEKTYDFIQCFITSEVELRRVFPTLKESLSQIGALWISWPKKSSKISSDISETQVLSVGLENGLVDTKVISIDETWSGLKFVYRLKDRKL